MRVVFDTSILVSATFWRGNPFRCLQAVEGRLCELVLSEPILLELWEKLARKFGLSQEECSRIDARLRFISTVIPLGETRRWVPDDPDDDAVVETAIAGKAEALVTGDRHILALRVVEGVSILTARQFVDRIAGTGT